VLHATPPHPAGRPANRTTAARAGASTPATGSARANPNPRPQAPCAPDAEAAEEPAPPDDDAAPASAGDAADAPDAADAAADAREPREPPDAPNPGGQSGMDGKKSCPPCARESRWWNSELRHLKRRPQPDAGQQKGVATACLLECTLRLYRRGVE